MNKVSNILTLGVLFSLILYPATWYFKNITEQSARVYELSTRQHDNNDGVLPYSFRSTSILMDNNRSNNIVYYEAPYLVDNSSQGLDSYVPTLTSNRKFASYSPHSIVDNNYNGGTNYNRNNQSETNTMQSAYANAINGHAHALTAHLHAATFAPFSATTPSEITAQQIDNQTHPAAIRGRQNGFPHPSDPDQSLESPVGEPWIMLIFTAAAAILVPVRKRLQQQRISRG